MFAAYIYPLIVVLGYPVVCEWVYERTLRDTGRAARRLPGPERGQYRRHWQREAAARVGRLNLIGLIRVWRAARQDATRLGVELEQRRLVQRLRDGARAAAPAVERGAVRVAMSPYGSLVWALLAFAVGIAVGYSAHTALGVSVRLLIGAAAIQHAATTAARHIRRRNGAGLHPHVSAFRTVG